MKQAKDLLDEIKRQAEKKSAKVEGALQELGNIQSEISSLKKDIINLVKDNNSTKKDMARAKKDTARVSRELAKKEQQASDRAKAGLPALSDDDKKSREATLAKNRAYKDELKYITARDSNASLKAKIKEANSVRPKPKLYANEKAYEKEKAKEKIESFAAQAQAGEVNWSVDALQLGKNYDPKKKDNKNPIKKSTNEFEKLNKEVAKTTKYMRIFGAAILGKKAFDTAKDMAEDRHQSRMLWGNLGLNREQQKKWQRTATNFGYDENVVAGAMGNVNNLLSELKKGNAIPADLLEVLTNSNPMRGLGFNVGDLKNMNGEQAFKAFMERMLDIRDTNPEALDILTTSSAFQSLFGDFSRWIQQADMQGKNARQVFKDSQRPVAEIASFDKKSGERQQAWSRLMDRLAEILDQFIDKMNPIITRIINLASKILGKTEGDRLVELQEAKSIDALREANGGTFEAMAEKLATDQTIYNKRMNFVTAKAAFGDPEAIKALKNLRDSEEFAPYREKYYKTRGDSLGLELTNQILSSKDVKEQDIIKNSDVFKGFYKLANNKNFTNEQVLEFFNQFTTALSGKDTIMNGKEYKGIQGLDQKSDVRLANASNASTNSSAPVVNKIEIRHNGTKTEVKTEGSTPTRANIQKG